MMRLFLLGVFVVLGNVYGYSQEQSRIIISKKNDPYTERFYKSSLNNSLTKVELYKPGQKFTATYYFQNEKLIYVKGNDTSGSDPLLLEIVFKNEKLVHVSHMGACGPGGMPQRLIDESKSYLLRYKLFHKMPH